MLKVFSFVCTPHAEKNLSARQRSLGISAWNADWSNSNPNMTPGCISCKTHEGVTQRCKRGKCKIALEIKVYKNYYSVVKGYF